jgi:glycosyltransferase involved in cell wall biosynthesis
MDSRIDLFTMPRAKPGSAFYTLAPSMAAAYPEQITYHEVPYNNLFFLLLRRPWTSRRRVLCIHWSTTLYGSKYVLKSLALLSANITSLAILKYVFSFKVVWVLHNNFAHDYPHPWIDAIGRALLIPLSDAFAAQQQVTAHVQARMYPNKRVVYIPHANYVGGFGPLRPDKAAMRERFGFAKDDIVLLSLGAVKPYKKIECFIDALHELGSQLPPTIKLWIVGKGDADYIQMLKENAGDSPRIRIEPTYIPDEEVPAYAACADYGVFFFDESELTSASVLLALSYGLPVISRSIPGTEMIEEGRSGFVFEDTQELLDILRRLPGLKAPSQESAIASVEGSDFRSVERRYMQLYEALTGGPTVL